MSFHENHSFVSRSLAVASNSYSALNLGSTLGPWASGVGWPPSRNISDSPRNKAYNSASHEGLNGHS